MHFPNLRQELLSAAIESFSTLRSIPGIKKKPSTSELLDWLKLLLAEDVPPAALKAREGGKMQVPPMLGALLKNEQDLALFEKLVAMQNRNR